MKKPSCGSEGATGGGGATFGVPQPGHGYDDDEGNDGGDDDGDDGGGGVERPAHGRLPTSAELNAAFDALFPHAFLDINDDNLVVPIGASACGQHRALKTARMRLASR